MNTFISRYSLVLLMIIAVSCKDGGDEVVHNQMELAYDGNRVELINDEVWANENCGFVYASASTASRGENLDAHFRIEFSLTTQGRINEILFFDHADQNRVYKSAYYKPAEVFFIENFIMDGTTLRFDFEGELYSENLNSTPKYIEGSYENTEFRYVNCSYEPWVVQANINGGKYQQVSAYGSSSELETVWTSLSDDGFRFSIISGDELKDMPLGTYSFSRNDLLDRVILETYSGPFTAWLTTSTDVWEQYEYEGELHIDQQNTQTIGRFKLKAFKGDEVIYEVTDGHFSI